MPKSNPVWFDTDEVPRMGVNTSHRLVRKQFWYKIVVWACVIFTPLAALTIIVTLSKKAVPAKSPQSTALNPPGRSPAAAALTQWLSSTPSPLPGGTIISWDGQTVLPQFTPPKSSGNFSSPQNAPTITAVVEHFTVLGASGVWYSAGVEVEMGSAGGLSIVGTPSLIAEPLPSSGSNNATTTGPWPGLIASSAPPGPVTQAVNGWAQAYGSGDAQNLTLAVGDTNSNDYFTPLFGVSNISASVTSYAELPNNAAVTEVSLTVTWSGQPPPSSSSQSTPPITMDLLIERATSAAPVVVAWGPPGTGPTLRPYQNAFHGYNSQYPPPPPPTTTTTQPSQNSAPPTTTLGAMF